MNIFKQFPIFNVHKPRNFFSTEGVLAEGDALFLNAQDHSSKFRAASPFPFTVFDNVFSEKLLKTVIKEFESLEEKNWHKSKNKVNEIKLSTENVKDFGHATSQVMQFCNSAPFVSFLETLTGIPSLIPDPHYRGGGMHMIRKGGKLGIHADFNFYPRLKLYRRLNVLIYLNPGWKEKWGGHLELWDYETKKCETKLAPLFNRMVVFETSRKSLHGHPVPLNCPEGVSRKSLALYYYTVDYPDQEDLEPHSTIFFNN